MVIFFIDREVVVTSRPRKRRLSEIRIRVPGLPIYRLLVLKNA